MNCEVCKVGVVEDKKINIPFLRDGLKVLVTGVPAMVCSYCRYYKLSIEAALFVLTKGYDALREGSGTKIIRFQID